MFGYEAFQFGDGGDGAVFAEELGADGFGALGVGRVGGKTGEGAVELFGPEGFFEAETAAEAFDFGAEERLVADVGDDDLGDAGVERAGGGAGAAVVDDRTGVLEELVVGNLADDLDVGVVAELGELGPAALDDDFSVPGPGADEAFHPGAGVFIDHAAEGEDGDAFAAGEGADFSVDFGAFGGLPATVAGEFEARVDFGAGRA